MIFSAAGLTLYFNKTTFGVERLSVDGDPELVSWVCGNDFALPYGNNFLLKSDFSGGKFSAEFLYFSEIVCSLFVTQKGDAISFSYRFKNDGKKKAELKEGDLGVYTPFFDRFDDPEISLRRRVHAHVRTEGATYIYCEKYSGDLPALGLIMTKGACYSYSLERGARKGDRGEIILRLPEMTLAPQETYTCEFRLFPCEGREDFRAKAEGYGMLAVRAQYFYSPHIALDVPACLFTPPPRVDSAFVVMPRRDHPPVAVADEALFFKVASAAFAMRRKTMENNLIASFRVSREQARSWLDDCGIAPGARGETLSLSDFAALSHCIQ